MSKQLHHSRIGKAIVNGKTCPIFESLTIFTNGDLLRTFDISPSRGVVQHIDVNSISGNVTMREALAELAQTNTMHDLDSMRDTIGYKTIYTSHDSDDDVFTSFVACVAACCASPSSTLADVAHLLDA